MDRGQPVPQGPPVNAPSGGPGDKGFNFTPLPS